MNQVQFFTVASALINRLHFQISLFLASVLLGLLGLLEVFAVALLYVVPLWLLDALREFL